MLILCTLDLSSPMQSTISIPLYLRVSSASFLAQFSPNEVTPLGWRSWYQPCLSVYQLIHLSDMHCGS